MARRRGEARDQGRSIGWASQMVMLGAKLEAWAPNPFAVGRYLPTNEVVKGPRSDQRRVCPTWSRCVCCTA